MNPHSVQATVMLLSKLHLHWKQVTLTPKIANVVENDLPDFLISEQHSDTGGDTVPVAPSVLSF